MSDEERRAYNSYEDSLRDQASYVETNYDFARMEGKEEGIGEGIRQGIEIGLEQGLEKGKLEVSRRLVAKGMSDVEAGAIAGIEVELLRHLIFRPKRGSETGCWIFFGAFAVTTIPASLSHS